MLLQISLVIFINQARNQFSPFLEVSFTMFSVTQKVENNYLQLKNCRTSQGQGEALGIFH